MGQFNCQNFTSMMANPSAHRGRLLRVSLTIGFFVALLHTGSTANAAAFTKGNLVVYRVGSGGSTALVATGNSVFLDEYTTAGTLMQSIALPTTGSGAQWALVASGTATQDGLLSRSSNGNCLAVPGYGRDLGTGTGNLATTGTTAANAAIPRVVGRVMASGAVDTSTALTDFALQSNFRGAASTDCSQFWVAGSAAAADTSPGVHYATWGATTSTDLTSATIKTARAVAVYGGQLYVSSGTSGNRGVNTVGAGTPSSASALSLARLNGLTDANSPSAVAFALADLDNGVAGVDTLYVADDTNGAGGGVTKFSLVAGTWISNGTVGSAADAYRGLTTVVNGSTVTLYATRKGSELVRLTDSSGYNGAFTGTPSVLATASANTAFRGVALAPEVTVTPSAGANGSISPNTAQTASAGESLSFTVSPDASYTAIVGGSCGGTLVGNTYTTVALGTNCTVDATFTQQATYAVTPSATPGGSITPSTAVTVISGTNTVFTVTPSAGFLPSVGGTCGGNLVGASYTTNPITTACTVEATFTPITYTMTPSAGANGTIQPSSAQTVNAGDTTTFTVTPDAGYSASVGGTCGGTLAGDTYTTTAASANCTVSVTFTALPTFTVSAVAVGNGTLAPSAVQTVTQNGTLTYTPTPANGYSVVMSGCGGKMSAGSYTTGPITGNCTVTASFSSKNILFVGNSYTFARVDPAMTFNAANVTDLTAAFTAAYPNGTNSWPWNGATCTGAPVNDGCFEPHPWGGVPGIFKALTTQAGLDYNVSFSTRNAATLRGHFLNTANSVWDLRGNIASQKWDIVLVQGQSDEPLPSNKSKNGNPVQFKTYANQIAKYVHQGNGQTTDLVTSEQAIFAAEGFGTSTSTTPRTIPPNPNANPDAKVYVMQNWARPDMVEAHKCTVADYTSTDGVPLVDPTCSAGSNGSTVTGQNNVFYTAQSTTALNLNDITNDMRSTISSLVTGNEQFAGVIPTGNAFQNAMDSGLFKNDGFYDSNGVYDESGLPALVWKDRTHASKFGSYLSALVHFGRLTGQDPSQFGAGDSVAAALGIGSTEALTLQQLAKATVVPAMPIANQATPGTGQMTLSFAAPANLGGLDITGYTATCGSQSTTGPSSPITVSGLTNGVPVTCTIAASNSVGTGLAATFASTTPNSAPGASNVHINGTAQVNAPLTGRYTYTDADADSEGTSSFRWLSGSQANGASATALPGATSHIYTPVATDVGTYLFFCVTPVAQTGTSAGTEVCSPATATVIEAAADGVCGSASGATSIFMPSTQLCSMGAATGVQTGTPSWRWSCTGTGGGATASCSAPMPTTGSSSGNAFATLNNLGHGWAVNSGETAGFIPATGHAKSPPNLPPGYQFPHGLFDFSLSGGTPGTSASVVLTFPTPLPAGTVYWKYGKTSASATPVWYPFPSAVISSDRLSMSLPLTDGAWGDDDAVANGVIVDPGGPGVPAAFAASDAIGIPTLSEWALLIMASLMMLLGMHQVRQRPRSLNG